MPVKVDVAKVDFLTSTLVYGAEVGVGDGRRPASVEVASINWCAEGYRQDSRGQE